MGKNWITTLAGLVLAIGTALTQVEVVLTTLNVVLPIATIGIFKLIGVIMAVIGGGVGLWAAKQWNVTGGSVPQASPPGAAVVSSVLGADLPPVKLPQK